ncbi:MAG: glycosyltransferase family 2 protein [Pyrinomonadaceae bacterium]
MSKPLSITSSTPVIQNERKVRIDPIRVISDADLTGSIRNPRLPHVSLIIPALNEEKSIGSVLNAIPRELVSEIIVVDNGSTDRTADIARHCGARVVSQPERGYGSACLAGIAEIAPDCEIVAFVDADFSDFPEDMEKLLKPLHAKQADMVIGTRTTSRESRSALTPQQRYGNWLATTLVRLFFGHRYTDLGPFRAIRRDALERLGMIDRDYGWTIEMQIKAARHGLRTTEVPVRYRVRIGRSKISGTVKGTILAGAKIIYTIFKYAAR